MIFVPNNSPSSLKKLRESVGLSQRALARELGVHHSNIQYWESSGKIPRSDLLPDMAKTLGVDIEALFENSPKNNASSSKVGGKLGKLFEEASHLPRSQQNKIIDLLEPFISRHKAS